VEIRRGDIFLANLDPTVGVEQAGTRPVLVVQCDAANERIPSVTIVPLTSNLRAGRFMFTVVVSSSESGLSRDSVILVFHVRTIDKRRLVRKIGHLGSATLSKVDQALAIHLDLPLP